MSCEWPVEVEHCWQCGFYAREQERKAREEVVEQEIKQEIEQSRFLLLGQIVTHGDQDIYPLQKVT
jgi:Zn ribbon nucleic-acid-binding protein